jgi:hypothetical protein
VHKEEFAAFYLGDQHLQARRRRSGSLTPTGEDDRCGLPELRTTT